MSLFKYLKEIEPNADVVTIRVCFGWDFSDLIPSAFPKVASSTNSFECIYTINMIEEQYINSTEHQREHILIEQSIYFLECIEDDSELITLPSK